MLCVVGAVSALLIALPARAGTLASGVLQATDGSLLLCVTNLDTKPLDVAPQLLDVLGTNIASADSCAGTPVAPGTSCTVNTNINGGHIGYCRVDAKGTKVRGSLLVINDGSRVVTSSLPLIK
jgi:hypothetical protein